MKDLLIHPRTKSQLDQYLSSLPHALILSGLDGSGKDMLILMVTDKLKKRFELRTLDFVVSKDFGIDELRELWQELGRKSTSPNSRRMVILRKADILSVSAQNSLLKHIEEPPPDVIFVLCVERHEQLLPTVRSRARLLEVLPIAKDQAADYLDVAVSDTKFAANYALSQGRVGQLLALANDQSQEFVANISKAKTFLTYSKLERLSNIDEILKDKGSSPAAFLSAMLKIATTALKSKPDQPESMQSWLERSHLLQRALQDLNHKANPKLILVDVFLNL